MNKNILKIAGAVTGLLFTMACTPDSYTFHDNEIVDVSTIESVTLVPNHAMVLADGRAQLDLRPVVITKEQYQIPDSRIDESWLEYSTSSGTNITRYFSTSDASLIGRTLTTKVKIKGTDVESEPISFQVVAPLDKKYTSEVKIPVVFHLIQTTEDIEKYGGTYTQERIMLLLTKLNNMFSGEASVNPVGVNTHIRMEPALYDQNGKKMLEPGINRLTMRSISSADNYATLLNSQHLVWPATKYMNIWLISDRTNSVENFANVITEKCTPSYVYAGTPVSGRPEGIEWTEGTQDMAFGVNLSGIIYKLQEIDVIDRPFVTAGSDGKPGYNDLGYYVGRYLGLLRTCSYSKVPVTDYCDDTHDYFMDPTVSGSNQTWYKQLGDYYFRAENIMDDPRGGHCSVSKNQCERMRWVLENCPERSAWKSNFAFTGK